MAEGSIRSAKENTKAAKHILGASVKLSHTKEHERFSADSKEKGDKNQKCFLRENCWKGSSHRNGITKRPVTG